MLDNITIGYLTGEHKALKNHLNSDEIIPRRPFTWGQMFFKPYESTTEYVFCARHTFIPTVLIGLIILNPVGTIVGLPLVVGGITLTLFALMGISEAIGSDTLFSFAFETGAYLIQDFCQALIDLTLLPVSALAMATRGISTGLQATGIYDYDADEQSESLTI
ncbi:hypothetical protein [Legionella fallonii]|uniref:Uncharacterized protein n=1 Tax=Legionella fallonii LLAP-10 TaxID=1212491 RepID=A0A098GA83_9GAMM|nr:hypothetical protein [Legionella fallonii]CEG58395.1 conserved protein of unknown function [Legionella fallonii LLAP-10]